MLPLDGPPRAVDLRAERRRGTDELLGQITALPSADARADPHVYVIGTEPGNAVGALINASDILISDDSDEPNNPDANIGDNDTKSTDNSTSPTKSVSCSSSASVSSSASEESLPVVSVTDNLTVLRTSLRF